MASSMRVMPTDQMSAVLLYLHKQGPHTKHTSCLLNGYLQRCHHFLSPSCCHYDVGVI